MKLEDFIDDLIGDCKFYLTGLQDFDQLVPYSLIMDYFDVKQTHRVNFPATAETMSRQQQYHMLANFCHSLNFTAIGLVSFLSLTAPAHTAIDERFWNREVFAALIGVSQPPALAGESTTYDSAMVFFDKDDQGELYISVIKDNTSWQDFIDNNVATFRDFLYLSSTFKLKNPAFHWPTMYRTLVNAGFEFEFESDEAKSQFVLAQPVLYSIA